MGEQQSRKIPQFMRLWQTLDSQERLSLLSQILDSLTTRELREVRNLAEQKSLSRYLSEISFYFFVSKGYFHSTRMCPAHAFGVNLELQNV
jgi:hypothetical protein